MRERGREEEIKLSTSESERERGGGKRMYRGGGYEGGKSKLMRQEKERHGGRQRIKADRDASLERKERLDGINGYKAML